MDDATERALELAAAIVEEAVQTMAPGEAREALREVADVVKRWVETEDTDEAVEELIAIGRALVDEPSDTDRPPPPAAAEQEE